MYDEKQNKNSSLEKLEKTLSKDSLNPSILYLIGNYYSEKGSLTIANSYFKKAYDNINHGYTGKDSSEYYSFKGILEYNLKYENAFNDFEKSLSINPNDQLTLLYYPAFLLSLGRFMDIKKLSINALEHKNTNPVLPYLFLIYSVIGESGQSIKTEIDENVNKKVEYRKRDFNQLYDFSLIEKYSKSSKKINEMKNARIMADICALFFKCMVFETHDNGELILEYTQNDLKRLEELKEWLYEASKKNKMNKYTLNKNLGYVNYMLNNTEACIANFTKALEIFPWAKRNSNFSPNDSFDALLAIYYFKNDTTNYRMTIQKKIASEAPNIKSAVDYRNLAFNYFSSGQLEKAEKWSKKAREIDSNDVETLRLLAHLYFLNGMAFMTDYYFDDLAKIVNNPYQGYEFWIQLAIYQIFNANAGAAIEKINMARQAFSDHFRRNRKCDLCDKLISNYIKIVD